MIDGRATHNFINEGLVRRRLDTKDFEGFMVIVADGYNLPCKKKIRKMEITFQDHKVCDEFHVIGLGDIDVILGVQWLHSLGEYTTNY